MGGACGTYGERRGAHSVLVGKPEAKIPLVRPWRRSKNNTKIHFKEIRWESWTGLIWLRIGTGGGLF
jgi:hypothetical protein